MNAIGKAIAMALVCAAAVSPSAGAATTLGYIGVRSSDPEKETFARQRWVVEGQYVLAFIGPARHVGTVTGDVEKDTLAYRPVLVTPVGGATSCQRSPP